MQELRIKGGNWNFTFDKPVFACAVFEISSFPDGEKKEITRFISDEASKEIDVFFAHSPLNVGDYPRADVQNQNKMQIRISNCKATEGTRMLVYTDKFSIRPWLEEVGQIGNYSPSIALNPKLNQEYILAYYFRDDDPYEVKATLSFVENRSEVEYIQKFDWNGTRTWKEVGENQ